MSYKTSKPGNLDTWEKSDLQINKGKQADSIHVSITVYV